MEELFRRLFRHPFLAFEIILASFFINILSLASPIFVIQVLNRYVGYGFDGTLVTLTAGMLIAGIMSHMFTTVRIRLASAVSVEPDKELAGAVLDTLSHARFGVISRIPPAKIHEFTSGVQTVQSGYDASTVCAVLDMPFLVIFITAILFLSPLLAIITVAAVLMTVLSGWISANKVRKFISEMQSESLDHRSDISCAISGADTVRTFRGAAYLKKVWSGQIESLHRIKRNLTTSGAGGQAMVQSTAILLRVMVYALGAREVVYGTMTTGALIGISILSGKALSISSSYIKSHSSIIKASDMLRSLKEFIAIPHESEDGTVLKNYKGEMEFKDLGFAYPGSTGPLFESFDLSICAGSFVVITGPNGSGKTTLLRLILGLLEPGRGQILAESVDLRQLSYTWWRGQVIYFPQEPTFLNTTIRENICINCPDISEDRLAKIIETSGLKRYLDAGVNGLEEKIVNGGKNLAVGIRRRIALARALTVQGVLAVLDEPMGGLDIEGRLLVDALLKGLLRSRKTVFMVTQDLSVIEKADIVVDLTPKPNPGILQPNGNPEENIKRRQTASNKKGESEDEKVNGSGATDER